MAPESEFHQTYVTFIPEIIPILSPAVWGARLRGRVRPRVQDFKRRLRPRRQRGDARLQLQRRHLRPEGRAQPLQLCRHAARDLTPSMKVTAYCIGDDD